MKTTFTLSFMFKVKDKKIVYPKWWQIWKKAKLVEYTWTDRKIITLLCGESEALAVFDSDVFRQYLQNGYDYPTCLQLENAEPHTDYIATECPITLFGDVLFIENAKENLLTHSDIEFTVNRKTVAKRVNNKTENGKKYKNNR